MNPKTDPVVQLRSALFGLIGVETTDELHQMEAQLRAMPVPDADKAVMLNAIQALLDTDPAKEAARRRAILETANEEYRAMADDHEAKVERRALVGDTAYAEATALQALQHMLEKGAVVILQKASPSPLERGGYELNARDNARGLLEGMHLNLAELLVQSAALFGMRRGYLKWMPDTTPETE